MRNVSDKSYTENQNTNFMLDNFFFENLAVYKIMWKNTVESGRPQTTIWRIASWIPKATNTRSEYVILIAFPLQHRASMLRSMYTACLVINYKSCIK